MITIRKASHHVQQAVVECDALALTDLSRELLIREAIRESRCYLAFAGELLEGYAVFDYRFFGFGFLSKLVVRERSEGEAVGRSLVAHLAGECTSPKLFTSLSDKEDFLQPLLREMEFSLSGIIYNVEAAPRLLYLKVLQNI